MGESSNASVRHFPNNTELKHTCKTKHQRTKRSSRSNSQRMKATLPQKLFQQIKYQPKLFSSAAKAITTSGSASFHSDSHGKQYDGIQVLRWLQLLQPRIPRSTRGPQRHQRRLSTPGTYYANHPRGLHGSSRKLVQSFCTKLIKATHQAETN